MASGCGDWDRDGVPQDELCADVSPKWTPIEMATDLAEDTSARNYRPRNEWRSVKGRNAIGKRRQTITARCTADHKDTEWSKYGCWLFIISMMTHLFDLNHCASGAVAQVRVGRVHRLIYAINRNMLIMIAHWRNDICARHRSQYGNTLQIDLFALARPCTAAIIGPQSNQPCSAPYLDSVLHSVCYRSLQLAALFLVIYFSVSLN